MNTIYIPDLLPRKERALDLRPVRRWLQGKRVAITGAGGFIGSELARQVWMFPVGSMTLIDNCEHNLYQISRKLPGARSAFADVRDPGRMRSLLRDSDVVFHAAAMKHVPICEAHPNEAWATNVGGTANIIDAAKGEIVFVSTDKAVNPSSKMGEAKADAERLCLSTGRAAVVRFGNVIGSSGSVVPLFQEQISAGGPLTITHRDMTRYFMTVGEAAELILQAGAQGPGTYVLDMGDPVKIMTLAQEMIRLSGRRDIEIVETGMRPGEKLHEELSTEPLVKTEVDGLFRAVERAEVAA